MPRFSQSKTLKKAHHAKILESAQSLALPLVASQDATQTLFKSQNLAQSLVKCREPATIPLSSGFFPPGYEDFDPKTPKNTLFPLVSAGSTLGEHAQGRDQKRRSDLTSPDFARNDQRGGKVSHAKQRWNFGVDSKGEGPTEIQARDTHGKLRQNFGVNTIGVGRTEFQPQDTHGAQVSRGTMGGLDFDPLGFEVSTSGLHSGYESPGTYAPAENTSQDSFTGGSG